MAKILIIDDDLTFSTQLSSYIEEMGLEWDGVGRLRDGLELVEKREYDIVFLDIFLPDGSGLDGISILKQSPSSPEVLIITAKGDPNGAEIALKNGAWHYIEKPAAYHLIQLLITRVLDYRERRRRFYRESAFNREFIIGEDPKLLEAIESVQKAAKFDGNVLITGETGTGKDIFSTALHINGSRRNKPMVTVDCTNITPTLASSLLFGHRKGAFTGADRDRDGLILQADGGMVFLDEVGDLPLETQKALLRVLQHKTFRPLGAKEEIPCEFRVVSATNRDLLDDIKKSKFRQDLFFRLATFRIHLPTLRERKGDIKLLALHYIGEICRSMRIETKSASDEFMENLIHYSWPGNVRELINVLQTAIANSVYEPVLYPHALPVEMRIDLLKKELTDKKSSASLDRIAASDSAAPFRSEDPASIPSFKDFKEEMEAAYLIRMMRAVDGDIKRACRVSGFSRARLYQLFRKHGFEGVRDRAFR